jgi:hypothetical protein
VPESNCTLCHPEIAVLGLPLKGTSDVSVTLVPEQAASKDQAGTLDSKRAIKDPSTCQTHALRVQFASVASIEKAGVKLGMVAERPMAEAMNANAEIQYNRTKRPVSSQVVAWWVGKRSSGASR